MSPRKIYVTRVKQNIAMHISQPVNNFLNIYFLCRFKHISNELHRTESKRARASECLNIMISCTDAAYAYKQRVMSTANFSMPPPVRHILENWFHGVHHHHHHGVALPSKSKALSTSLRQAERSAASRHAVWRSKLSGSRSALTVHIAKTGVATFFTAVDHRH